MFNLAVPVLLLCLCGIGEAGFFSGCVQEANRSRVQDSCVFVPDVWLKSETYRNLGHLALADPTMYPHHRNATHLSTVLHVTRAANQVLNGIVTRLEFTTVESSCKLSDPYSKEICLPIDSQPNGICQARFRYTRSLKLEDVMCEPGLWENFESPLY
ncbi:salivary cystatin-L-like [Amblyomma americanum]|uniref:Secreted protein n=1 Tax=Amblyomma americanum TaxID=6943 RepID=A0AAQ4FIU2_AMBAM